MPPHLEEAPVRRVAGCHRDTGYALNGGDAGKGLCGDEIVDGLPDRWSDARRSGYCGVLRLRFSSRIQVMMVQICSSVMLSEKPDMAVP